MPMTHTFPTSRSFQFALIADEKKEEEGMTDN